DVAYFGEKDYQQLLIVRRLARDLDIPVRIAAVPTVRAADGLALSSRNAYLSQEERRIAPTLARVLREIAASLAHEPHAVARELARGAAALASAGFAVEYLEVRDAETLAPIAAAAGAPARVFAAVRLGKTRLIDNMPIAA
ncbi:MAG TPA: pantoate--beta-alanine ligase, partial [Stellaceae bacterium]|nr:pantoate--beta-alanine ligase [Stellaceae bacterium]